MDMVNKFFTFMSGLVTQMMGWANTFFSAVLPSSTADDAKKNQFIKYGLIVIGLFFAAQMLRVNINTGGGGASAKGGKK